MFARWGNPKFGTAQWNENTNDADSVRAKDFVVVSGATKATTAVTNATKTFTQISTGSTLGNPFTEVAG